MSIVWDLESGEEFILGADRTYDAASTTKLVIVGGASGAQGEAESRRLRALAAEFFDSNTVIGRLLDEVGIAA